MNPLWAMALAALSGAVLFLAQWVKQRQDQGVGAQLEAGKVDAVSAVKETAIAQAVVDAPKTQQAVVDQLKAGTF